MGELLFQFLAGMAISSTLHGGGRPGGENRTVQRPGDGQGLWGFGSMLKTSTLCCDQPGWTFTQLLWHMSLIHCTGDGHCFHSMSSLSAGIDNNCKDGLEY